MHVPELSKQIFLQSSFSQQLSQIIAESLEKSLIEGKRAPFLLYGTAPNEASQIVHQIHQTLEKYFGESDSFIEKKAHKLLNQLQREKAHALQSIESTTLHITDYEQLSGAQRLQLLHLLQQTQIFQSNDNLLFISCEREHPSKKEKIRLDNLFPNQISIPPLHQRTGDIDRILYARLEGLLLLEKNKEIQGFSLEATTHIHRAIIQTQRSFVELDQFLQTVLEKALVGNLPLHNQHIVTWPTVRMLEDLWGYKLHGSPSIHDELESYNFKERLFSASLEQASRKSGLSRELIELHNRVMLMMIRELPEHQKNYQGLTSHFDQLNWLNMKLLSGARTQAEMRDFFGFGGAGKIPKATVKLKFDQYNLKNYGFNSADPTVWTPLSEKEPALSSLATPKSPAPKRRIHEVQGELEQTLFWRHQDLFTLLSSGPLTLHEISDAMGHSPEKIEEDLQELLHRDLLQLKADKYSPLADDIYFMHTRSQLRFTEDNLLRYLGSSFQTDGISFRDNLFLKLPAQGLPEIRQKLINPFLYKQFLPLSDQIEEKPSHYDPSKKMYALLLIGTDRLSQQVHSRVEPQQRILHYFREAALQRATTCRREQAICLQATQMLTPDQAAQGMQYIHGLQKQLKEEYLPHGRGNKPNFNMTVCFTPVELNFYRDLPRKRLNGHFSYHPKSKV